MEIGFLIVPIHSIPFTKSISSLKDHKLLFHLDEWSWNLVLEKNRGIHRLNTAPIEFTSTLPYKIKNWNLKNFCDSHPLLLQMRTQQPMEWKELQRCWWQIQDQNIGFLTSSEMPLFWGILTLNSPILHPITESLLSSRCYEGGRCGRKQRDENNTILAFKELFP